MNIVVNSIALAKLQRQKSGYRYLNPMETRQSILVPYYHHQRQMDARRPEVVANGSLWHFNLCVSNVFFSTQLMLIFTPTERIFLDSQILSHWYYFEAQLVGINICKKPKFYRNMNLHLWKQTFGDLFFSKHHPTHPVSTPKPSCCEKQYTCSSTKPYYMCCLKATTVELSVATMYDTVHNFFRLTSLFKSHTFISWGLFVTRGIELLVSNHTLGGLQLQPSSSWPRPTVSAFQYFRWCALTKPAVSHFLHQIYSLSKEEAL